MLWWVDWRRVPHKGILLGILLYSVASLFWMEVRLDGYLELWHLVLLLVAFSVGAVCGNLEKPLTLMAITVAITLPAVALQSLGYSGVPQTAPPAGLFLNKNVLAETAAVLLIAMIYLRNWALVIPLLIITVLAREKAAYAGMAVAMITYLWPRSPRLAGAVLAIGMVLLAAFVGSLSATERFDIWLDTWQGTKWYGNGIGSYFTVFPASATHYDVLTIRPEYAHNEFLHVLFEYGIGSIGFLLLTIYALRGSRELERLIFVSILAVSLFAFPLHMPITAFLAALVAGRLCSSGPDRLHASQWLPGPHRIESGANGTGSIIQTSGQRLCTDSAPGSGNYNFPIRSQSTEVAGCHGC